MNMNPQMLEKLYNGWTMEALLEEQQRLVWVLGTDREREQVKAEILRRKGEVAYGSQAANG